MAEQSAAAMRRPRARVLVVDDEPKFVEFLKEALEAHQYEVATASDGQQALREARNQKLNLILLDLVMPMMDGLQVLDRLKAHQETSQIPVVVVTGQADTKTIFEAQRLRATDILVKPIDIAVLLSTIKRYISDPT